LNKEFWIWNTGEFIKMIDVEEIKTEDINFKILQEGSPFQIIPENADKLYKGYLKSKKIGKIVGRNEPEQIGEWEELTPIKIVLAIKYVEKFKNFISIYPIPSDIKYSI